jgi:hypothetical protein
MILIYRTPGGTPLVRAEHPQFFAEREGYVEWISPRRNGCDHIDLRGRPSGRRGKKIYGVRSRAEAVRLSVREFVGLQRSDLMKKNKNVVRLSFAGHHK